MKKIIISLFLFIATTLAFVLPVSADTGPKPYLDISITNLEKSDYILGLIFFKENHGPHIAYDIENKNTTEINIHIGYYPPEDFKVILYDEISDQITISDKYSLYAFASYYKTDATLSLKKNYKAIFLNRDFTIAVFFSPQWLFIRKKLIYGDWYSKETYRYL